MKIKEQKVLRLTIEFPYTCKDDVVRVLDYLDDRFGQYGYTVRRDGPKQICDERLDMFDHSTREMVVEADVTDMEVV